jgi:hypothetical protein
MATQRNFNFNFTTICGEAKMRCPNCSAEINDNASQCDFCGHVITAAASVSPPPAPASESNPYAGPVSPPTQRQAPNQNGEDISNHMVLSIVSAVISLCSCYCIPLGIVAVIMSVLVNSKINAGDIAGARNFSNIAKILAWVTIGLSVLMIIYYVVMIMTNPEITQQFMEGYNRGRQGG